MKKITLSLDKSVQKQLSADHQWSAAYQAALAWYARLIHTGIDFHGDPVAVENCTYSEHPALEKLLCPTHHEGMGVQRVFREAYRLDARLRSISEALILEVNAYHEGEKSEYYQIEIWFLQDGRIFAGSRGYRSCKDL